MISRTAIHLLTLSLSGCSLQTQTHDTGQTTLLAGRVAGKSQRCVIFLGQKSSPFLMGSRSVIAAGIPFGSTAFDRRVTGWIRPTAW